MNHFQPYNFQPYQTTDVLPSEEEIQAFLAWIFFFWILIPFYAVVGLIDIIKITLNDKKD